MVSSSSARISCADSATIESTLSAAGLFCCSVNRNTAFVIFMCRKYQATPEPCCLADPKRLYLSSSHRGREQQNLEMGGESALVLTPLNFPFFASFNAHNVQKDTYYLEDPGGLSDVTHRDNKTSGDIGRQLSIGDDLRRFEIRSTDRHSEKQPGI